MLTLAVELYETDADALALAHRRYSWFSVDEYQDTNRLQEDLLRLWLGDRRDLCVVGDPDQTIYSFTGASSDYLTTFADRYADARVVRLSHNYRSTPQVLDARQPAHPRPRAALARLPMDRCRSWSPMPMATPRSPRSWTRIRALLADGVPLHRDRDPGAHERAARAIRGRADRGRDPVHRPRRSFLRPPRRARRPRGAAGRRDRSRLSRIVATRWRTELGFDEADPPGPASGAEARDRHAALSTLLGIARSLERGAAGRDRRDFLAELARRDAAEADAGGEG